MFSVSSLTRLNQKRNAIDAEILRKEREERNRVVKEGFEKIYRSCWEEIKEVNRFESKYSFHIPLFMPSIANYDSNNCRKYLLKKLKRDNFKAQVDENNPYVLNIEW